jgi:hypothetical protein
MFKPQVHISLTERQFVVTHTASSSRIEIPGPLEELGYKHACQNAALKKPLCCSYVFRQLCATFRGLVCTF